MVSEPIRKELPMIYYEQDVCDLDNLPVDTSELYRILHELDPQAAKDSLYTIEIPLGKDP